MPSSSIAASIRATRASATDSAFFGAPARRSSERGRQGGPRSRASRDAAKRRVGFHPHATASASRSFRALRQRRERDFVLPGNKEFVAGDRIENPGRRRRRRSGPGRPRIRRAARTPSPSRSPRTSSSTSFRRPRTSRSRQILAETDVTRVCTRAGYSDDGTTPNLDVLRTMRNSMAGAWRCDRPTHAEIERARGGARSAARRRARPDRDNAQRRALRRDRAAQATQRAIPFIDPIDVRYNRFAPHRRCRAPRR